MGYGNQGSRGRGLWPGNGPFRNLPPWERPGWLYGPGSCWTMGYWRGTGTPIATAPPTIVPPGENLEILQRQKDSLVAQLEYIQQTISRIEERIMELEKK